MEDNPINQDETGRKNTVEDKPAAKKFKTSEERDNGDQMLAAKIVQFKKPVCDKSEVKVIHGVMELLDGEFKGMRGFFQSSAAYVWGYNLTRANLMYILKPGDVFLVKASKKTITAVYGNFSEAQEIPLVIQKCWLGIKSEVPQNIMENVEFSAWLSERDLSEHEFKKWINDRLPPKSFFPLPSETHQGTVISLIRETAKCDGGLIKITDGFLKDSIVLFEREDMYICGVSVGSSDLRMLIRPGDKIAVQVQLMSEKEKHMKEKKYPKIEEFEIQYTALLAYLGNKRPRSPQLLPKDSMDLRDFLVNLGLTIEEFDEIRNPKAKDLKNLAHSTSGAASCLSSFSISKENVCHLPSVLQLPPFNGAAISAFCPNMPLPSAIPPMGEKELEQLSKCAVIISRALVVSLMKEQNGADINIGEIIESEEDVENAIRMGRWLTEALIAKMQSHLQEKIKTKLGPNFGSILSTQKRQIEAAVTAMTPTGGAVGQGSPETASMTLLQQQTLAKQLFESKEEKSKKADLLLESRTAKDSWRSGRDRDRKRAHSPQLDLKEVEEERKLSPMELLRKYVMLNRRIRSGSDDTVVLGEIRYSKDMKVNFRVSNNYELTGGPKEYYTMECIYYFARNIEIDHTLYVRRALTDNLPVVRKPDREPLINYLTGNEDFVPNLEIGSNSELNPCGPILSHSYLNNKGRQERKMNIIQDSISQAINIVSEKMCKINPEIEDQWKESNDPVNAIEKWKSKNLMSLVRDNQPESRTWRK